VTFSAVTVMDFHVPCYATTVLFVTVCNHGAIRN